MRPAQSSSLPLRQRVSGPISVPELVPSSRATLRAITRAVLATALALVGMAAASALEPTTNGPAVGAMSACANELAILCKGIEAGGGKKMRCLTEHQSELSSTCATSVQARQAARAARTGSGQVAQAPTASPPSAATPPSTAPTPLPNVGIPRAQPIRMNLRACRSDIATFCLGVEKGGGRRIKCLIENQAKVSPDCAATLTVGQQKREVNKAVCGADARTFCAKTRGPERLKCLEINKAQLSPACAAVLEQRLIKQTQRSASPAKQ